MQTQRSLSSAAKLTVRVVPREVVCEEADAILHYLEHRPVPTNRQRIQNNLAPAKRQWFESSSSDFEERVVRDIGKYHATEQQQLLRAVRAFHGHGTQRPYVLGTELRAQQRAERERAAEQERKTSAYIARSYRFDFEQRGRPRPLSQLQTSRLGPLAAWALGDADRQRLKEMRERKLGVRAERAMAGAQVGQCGRREAPGGGPGINRSDKALKVRRGTDYDAGVQAAFKKVSAHAPEWRVNEHDRRMQQPPRGAEGLGPGKYDTAPFPDGRVRREVEAELRRLAAESRGE
ncbi:hypothetical protein SS50377_28165 [Spironucleus salmonicida]|uniref:Uncharacterized protein n=1 Tax=Spironucleus salmonicida TaxID=348837 RepID=V6LSX7_9EUKA|nr:hypothetical protein SS50377_28161 [Spironucleus salmonicida]KAH0570190.1 hypothetical protein SS50377_28165 [Spironucleus salmonicida]|eukprot:EST47675.1 Hypothetical protein SS50377_12261 [Spironucleus salmonicida]